MSKKQREERECSAGGETFDLPKIEKQYKQEKQRQVHRHQNNRHHRKMEPAERANEQKKNPQQPNKTDFKNYARNLLQSYFEPNSNVNIYLSGKSAELNGNS